MGCKKNRSKKCSSWFGALAFFAMIVSGVVTDRCWAAFASKFSLAAGEQYTDNIFFTKDKEHDFITVITPTLTLLFAPQGQTVPTINLSISPSAHLYARHSDLNNFGRNLSLTGGYTERLTPRLSLYLSDTLSMSDASRSSNSNSGGGGVLGTQTSTPIPGGTISNPNSQQLQDFTSVGNVLTNSFVLRGTFLYQPNLSFNADYVNQFTSFLSRGGSDLFQTIGVRGVYNWRQEHNLHAGYSIGVAKARNGTSTLIHNFDVGDDFFSNVRVRLSPTLTLALSSGFSISANSGGPRVANNLNLTATKVWQTATLSGGIRKGLTPSFGVSGTSDTTTFFTHFDSRLTNRLTGKVAVDFSLFDTENVNFKTFRATAGLQYLINTWLSSNLSYDYRSSTNGAGASSSTLLQKGTIQSNTVFLSLAAHFDLWPNPGLARGGGFSAAVPVISPPFSHGSSPSFGVGNP